MNCGQWIKWTISIFVLLDIPRISSYLAQPQLRIVQAIIKHPDSPEPIRKKAKQILFQSYLPWAYKQGHEFIRQHKTHANNIVKPNPLLQYAMSGYVKSIEKYNGSAPFHLYAKYYIQGSMYRGLTELTPLKPYKHSEYYAYRNHIKNTTGINVIGALTNRLVAYEHYWTFDKLCLYGQESIRQIENRSRIEQIHMILDEMDGPFRRLFYLRYDYATLKIKTPIDKICVLMGYSHETYRKRMNAIMKHVREHVSDPSNVGTDKKDR